MTVDRCIESGRGIIRTAADGPTNAVITSRIDMESAKVALRLFVEDGAVNTDRKSKDHRYDRCVACIAPDSAPSGM